MSNFLLWVSKNIERNVDFQRIFHDLYHFWLINDLKQDIANTELKQSLVVNCYEIILTDEDIKKVIQSAFIFAGVEESEHVSYYEADKYNNLAYIIGFSLLWYIKFYQINSLKKVVYRLFTKLWLIVGRDKFIRTAPREVDIYSKIEITRKELGNRLVHSSSNEKANDEEIYLTDFQKGVIDSLNDQRNKVIWISWPTSSGKNFAVKHYLIKELTSKEDITVCIVVPTKALINEQSVLISSELKKYHITANLFTFGDIEHYREGQNTNNKNIFILTQERLHYFFELIKNDSTLYSRFKIDILVIDESYKIGYWNRWVLLNYIIKTLFSLGKVKKLILLSPMVKQLKTFWKILWIEEAIIHEKYSEFSPVFQNKIRIEEEPREKIKKFYYLSPLNQEKRLAFEYNFGFAPSKPYKNKLTEYAVLFSTRQSLIVFRNWPRATEKQAKEISDKILDNTHKAEGNDSLIEYIVETVGENYDLIEPLRKGVAFHHGKVPISIRSKIEENFKKGSISVLCATKTLSEGVNLPVKYLLIADDIKGESKLDFKNLCWRVGRYSNHLSWSLFFINPSNYCELLDSHSSDPRTNEEKPISPLSHILEENLYSADGINKKDNFIEYLTSSNHRISRYIDSKDGKYFEYLTGFLFDMFCSTPDNFDMFVRENTSLWNEYIAKLRDKLGVIKTDMETMGSHRIKEICRKNIFIDPRKQLDLYEWIRSWSHVIKPFKVTPSSSDFVTKFEELSLNIARAFLRVGTKDWTQFYPHSSYLLDWVTEKSILTMRRHLKRGENIKVLELFDILEQEISFKYLNAINVYMDVVNLCVNELDELIDYRTEVDFYDKNVISYVECWAYTPLTLLLISKGIYRDSALIIKKILLSEWVPLFGTNEVILAKIREQGKAIRSKIHNPIVADEFSKI